MFTRLLERKLWANKNEDLIDTLYFDERIRRKNQKVKKPSKNVNSLNLMNFIVIIVNILLRR